MKIKHILIDLDGTLTDPHIGITTCIRYAMQKMAMPLDEHISLDWCIGPPLKASFLQLLQTADEEKAEQALAFYRERFSRIGLFENEVYPYVAVTLKTLREQGYTLWVATAKPTIYATQILKHFALADYFQHIYGSELNGVRTDKGDLIAYILERENLLAEQCIMVGDREFDILGARKNRIKTIAVNYGYGTKEEIAAAKPNYVIDSFAALPTILEQLRA